MKTLIDVLSENIAFHAQQICTHEKRLISALEDLDEVRAGFRDWLRVFMYIENLKMRTASLAQFVPNPEDLFAYLENAQAIMAKKIVAARKDKHEAILFSFLCRHVPIVRRAKATFRPKRGCRVYRVACDESPETVVLKA